MKTTFICTNIFLIDSNDKLIQKWDHSYFQNKDHLDTKTTLFSYKIFLIDSNDKLIQKKTTRIFRIHTT